MKEFPAVNLISNSRNQVVLQMSSAQRIEVRPNIHTERDFPGVDFDSIAEHCRLGEPFTGVRVSRIRAVLIRFVTNRTSGERLRSYPPS